MVWIGKELKTHPVLPLPWAGAPSTVPGSSKPNPVWPWTLPKIQGQPQLLWAACHVIGITLFNTLLCVAEPQESIPLECELCSQCPVGFGVWVGQSRGSQAPQLQFKSVILGFYEEYLAISCKTTLRPWRTAGHHNWMVWACPTWGCSGSTAL